MLLQKNVYYLSVVISQKAVKNKMNTSDLNNNTNPIPRLILIVTYRNDTFMQNCNYGMNSSRSKTKTEAELSGGGE